MKFKLTTCTVVLATAFMPTLAQADAPVSVPLFATSARQAIPINEVIGDVSIIDHEQLQNSGNGSLGDLLSRQPGIQVSTSGGPQTVTSVYLRGSNGNHSLVLVNGIRINDFLNGTPYWANLDPYAFDRVEIVRGAGSSLYGSGAMGGVINLNSVPLASGKPFSYRAQVGVGTQGSFKTGANFSGSSHGLDYALSADYDRSNGFDATNNHAGVYHNPDQDGYRSYSLSGGLGYTYKPGQRLELTFLKSRNHGEYDSGTYNPTYGVYSLEVYGLQSNNQITPWWQSILKFGFAKSKNQDFSNYPGTFTNYHREVSWQNNFDINTNHHLSLILDHSHDNAESPYVAKNKNRNINGLGLIYRGDFKFAHLQASWRHDHYSDFGNANTGSLGFDFDLNPEWTAGVSYSTAFNAPTFSSLYGTWQSNPHLKPEHSRNLEAHITYQTSISKYSLTLYKQWYRGLIGSNGSMPVNIDRANIKGLTLSGEQQFGNTKLWGSIDLLDPRDSKTGKVLQRRAKQMYRIGVDQKLGHWTLGADYLFVGHTQDKDYSSWPASDVNLGGFGVFNLKASYQINKHAEIQAFWNNVTNKKYQYFYGYNGQGSNAFINFVWKG